MESCMSNAVYSKMKCTVCSPLSERWVFIHDAVTPLFMGWKAVKYGVDITNKGLNDDQTKRQMVTEKDLSQVITNI